MLLGYTSFGKNVYAIGGNIKAAEISGVNVKKNLVMIYGYAGLCAAVAALVFAGRVGSVHPGAATGYEPTDSDRSDYHRRNAITAVSEPSGVQLSAHWYSVY